MTTGAITPLLVHFTIPLVLGNLFQLTYNAVDSIIVGRFVGEAALAAVGTANPLMTLAILFINGMCLGAGILVSTAYGAGDRELVERQVSTTALFGRFFSVLHPYGPPAPAAAASPRRHPAHSGRLPAGGLCGPDLHLFI